MKDRTLIVILFLLSATLLVSRAPLGIFVSGLLRQGAGEGDSAILRREIVVLRSRLAQLDDSVSAARSSGGTSVAAPVFSSYPFNFKKEILVGAGRDKGIAEGQAVVVPAAKGGGVLLGTVAEVFDNTARVRTIFDIEWSSAVRVGDKGAQALLSGGLAPELSLIPKDAGVVSGDVIYSADAKYPYGLAIGTLKDLQIAKEQAYQKGLISFSYDFDKIRSVLILSGYVPPRTHK